MGLLYLLYLASIPVLKMLLIGGVGAVLSTQYAGVLTEETRKSLNKVVFVVFTPALLFASLVQSVTFEDLVSWKVNFGGYFLGFGNIFRWSMPVNVFFTFIIGSILGWLVVKISKAPKELHGIIISNCCAGNMGILLLIVVPNLCEEDENPFGDSSKCKIDGIAYVSFSMALGCIFIWTYAYAIMQSPNQHCSNESEKPLLDNVEKEEQLLMHKSCSHEHTSFISKETFRMWCGKFNHGLVEVSHLVFHELKSPPNFAVVAGFLMGAIPQIKNLFVGESAPLNVILNSFSLLGDGTIPSCILILGGNLLLGLKSSRLKFWIILLVICVKFILMPLAGLYIVKGAARLGLLPNDPLYQFVLMIQYAVPPAVSLGTIAQLFNRGEQECSVLFLWTYLIASIAITFWSTMFMSILV